VSAVVDGQGVARDYVEAAGNSRLVCGTLDGGWVKGAFQEGLGRRGGEGEVPALEGGQANGWAG
jgi:hypothetical protein